MTITRNILFVFGILVFFYVFYRVFENQQILKQMRDGEVFDSSLNSSSSSSSTKEGFLFSFFNTPETELDRMRTKESGPGVVSVKPEKANLPLREYCIKSSYNTGFSGSYMNLETIKYILSRGCRFLDFEVYVIENIPCIAYSKDPTYTNMTAENTIPLVEVCRILSYYGFSSPTPNMGDPLFIQLRIHPQPVAKTDGRDTTGDIYKYISMVLSSSFQERLYQGKVSGDTLLRDLLGKIVLVVDKTTIPEYSKYPVCQTGQTTPCYNLSNYVNIESGGDILRSYTFGNLLDQYTTPPYIHDDGITSNVQKFKMVVPALVSNTMNPEYYPFVLNYGVQIVMQQFYKKDVNLELYEQFFSDNLSAFVPMNLAIPYCKKQQNYVFDEWGMTETNESL